MNPLDELFSTPVLGPNLRGDLPLVGPPGDAPGSVLYYNGQPLPAAFIRADLAMTGMPLSDARAFLASSVVANFAEGTSLGILDSLATTVGRMWNADLHPRGDHGHWAESGGTKTPNAVKALNLVENELQAAGVGYKKSADYRAAATAVIGGMTHEAQKRFAANVSKIHFAKEHAAVSGLIRDRLKQMDDPTEVPDGVSGAYIRAGDTGEVVANGGIPGMNKSDGVDTLGVYAHEFGHAIDGPDCEISDSTAWEHAWENEILRGKTPPSAYAQQSPSEGFAEFHRLLAINKKAATTMYPACAEVWKKHKLL
jgi:hypothetical protein